MADINKPLPFPEPILHDKPRPPLPCPDPVPEVPMRQSKGPGFFNRLWKSLCDNKWNILRHLILGAAAVAGVLFAKARGASNAETATGATLVTAIRKWIDDELRAHGHRDIAAFIISLFRKAAVAASIVKPKLEGDAMSTRTDVEEVGTAIYDLVMAVFCKDEDKAAKILTATLATIKEGADLMDIPKDDIPEAAAHALSMATAKAIAAKVVYTDEKPPTV